MADERVRAAKSLFNEQVRDLREQMQKKMRLVNELCEELGEPKEYPLEDILGGGGVVVQPGEFFTRPLATVVTTILERRKVSGLAGPALVDEIYPLMIEGGYLFDAKNDATATRSLSIALAKNPKFVKLSSEHIALADWYDLPKSRTKDTDKKPASEETSEHKEFLDAFDTAEPAKSPRLYRVRLRAGGHIENGPDGKQHQYKPGDVFDSLTDLAKRWPEKFENVVSEEVAVK